MYDVLDISANRARSRNLSENFLVYQNTVDDHHNDPLLSWGLDIHAL